MGVPSIVVPSDGLNQLPDEPGVYPQVFVNNAGGEVKLTNIMVDGSDAVLNFEGLVFAVDNLCPTGALQNFVGVYFVNTPGVLESVNVSNQFASFFLPEDEGPQVIPNCGSGVQFSGSRSAVVRNSSVSNVGFQAVYSNGDLTADHNVISGGFGPHSIGIGSVSGTIANNTITGSIGYFKTVGIQGGDVVRDNVVQSTIYGIMGAGTVRNNTLTNNAISVSGGVISPRTRSLRRPLTMTLVVLTKAATEPRLARHFQQSEWISVVEARFRCAITKLREWESDSRIWKAERRLRERIS